MKLKLTVAIMLVLALFVGATFAAEPAKFHIGIMTGTVSQSEDDLRGAELMIKMYGDSANGGMITHITYPDNFPSEQETTISQIVGLADDPLMKVIVVNQAVPGTAEGFRRVREKRSDILLLAGEPHEDPGVITESSHIATHTDHIGRGYALGLAYLVGQLAACVGDAGAGVLLIEFGNDDIGLAVVLADLQAAAGGLVPRAAELEDFVVVFFGYFHCSVLLSDNQKNNLV